MAPHENSKVCVDTPRVVLWVRACYVPLPWESGIERVPAKCKGGQKLGGTLSRFGDTSAVFKDLDRWKKRLGRNRAFFVRRRFMRTDGLPYSLAEMFKWGHTG